MFVCPYPHTKRIFPPSATCSDSHHLANAAVSGGVLLTVGEIKEKKEKGKEGEGEKRGVCRRNGTISSILKLTGTTRPRAHSSRASAAAFVGVVTHSFFRAFFPANR